MNIKELEKNNIKNIIIIFLFILIIVVFTNLLLQNKEYETKKVTNDLLDNELVAVRIKNESGEYEKTKDIPLNSYILNEEESYCGIKQDDGTYSKEEVAITYKSGKVTIDKVNKNGMKCFLYFDKALCQGAACEAILANNSVDASRIGGEFTSTFEEDTAGRIFKGPEDDYDDTTYFFAGKAPNNWVQFANKWWRIIRINGDGSIRLIYAGSDATKAPQPTGEDTQIGTSAFNSSYDDNAYVGYMYGTAGSDNYNDTHANTNSSTIKEVLDTWYDNNIGNNTAYSSKIATNIGFCGDRKVDKSANTSYQGDGYGPNATGYAPWARLYTNNNWKIIQTSSLKCSQSNDLYTVSNASRGNKVLTYPVGLITSDEVVFAGGLGGTNNTRYWLYTNQYYWTMSPSNLSYYGGDYFAYLFYVTSNGYFTGGNTNSTLGVRPVINLKSDTQLTGTGTTTDPYKVV